MATKFLITRIRRTDFYECWVGDLPSVEHRAAVVRDLLQQGWDQRDIDCEVAALSTLHKKNVTDKNTLPVTLEYVFTHLEPGDVLQVEGMVWVCQQGGCA